MASERSPREPAGSGPVVLIPIKDFTQAKNRLAPALDGAARQSLAREMAEGVVRAAEGLDVRVVCNDPEVAAWAVSVGARVAHVDVEGLNQALTAAVAALEPEVRHVLIAHGDLPFAESLADVATPGLVTIVPDRHVDGTNVLAIPAGGDFEFQYGPGSFIAHVREAMKQGLDVVVRRRPDLGWDVDTPDDLAEVPREP